jgi:hypothetical protein
MITAEERRQIEKRSKQREARLRRKYPEVHGKVVDFITHTIDDGTLYFTVRFTDKTSFCLRYACGWSRTQRLAERRLPHHSRVHEADSGVRPWASGKHL